MGRSRWIALEGQTALLHTRHTELDEMPSSDSTGRGIVVKSGSDGSREPVEELNGRIKEN